MLLKTCVIAMLCLAVFQGFSQNSIVAQVNAQSQIVSSLASEVASLRDRVAELEHINKITGMEYLHSQYSSIFDKWLTIQAIFLAFLAALAILLPLLTYYFGYKPAKDAESRLMEIEAKFEPLVRERLTEYLNQRSRLQLTTALENTMSSDPELRAQAIIYLGLNQYQLVDDDQAGKIYEILTDESVPEQTKLNLRSLHFNKVSLWAEKYISWLHLHHAPRDIAAYFEARYLAINPSDDVFAIVEKHLEGIAPEAALMHYYLGLVIHSVYGSKAVAIRFLNNKKVIDRFSHQELKAIMQNAITHSEGQGFDVKDTYLVQATKDALEKAAKERDQ